MGGGKVCNTNSRNGDNEKGVCVCVQPPLLRGG